MGTITGKTIIDAVAKTLQDDTNIRWPRAELLEYLNDAQREIVLAKPDSFVKNENLQLVAGTKQTIPANGVLFMRVNRNMGVGGNAPGRVPRLVDIRILDEQIPDWHSETAAAVVKHYTFDEQDPKRFYVYPPQPATGMSMVEVVYSASPTDLAVETAPITLDDVYKTAMVKYMEFRAWNKDADYAANPDRADRCYANFAALIGLKDKADDEQKAGRVGAK